MLFDVIQSGFEPRYLVQLLYVIIVFLLAISVHESAHAFYANMLGDPTAKNLGRITLNPLKHLDPFGVLAMLVFGFGWAKPVPVRPRYMKNAKWGFALSSLAGPFSNLLLAFVFAILRAVAIVILSNLYVADQVPATLLSAVLLFFLVAINVNVSLAVFNMLPIPPLDGSRLLTAIFPRKWAEFTFRYEQYVQIALFVLLYLGAFTGILSGAIDAVTDFVTSTVDLIPFGNFSSDRYLFEMLNLNYIPR